MVPVDLEVHSTHLLAAGKQLAQSPQELIISPFQVWIRSGYLSNHSRTTCMHDLHMLRPACACSLQPLSSMLRLHSAYIV